MKNGFLAGCCSVVDVLYYVSVMRINRILIGILLLMMCWLLALPQAIAERKQAPVKYSSGGKSIIGLSRDVMPELCKKIGPDGFIHYMNGKYNCISNSSGYPLEYECILPNSVHDGIGNCYCAPGFYMFNNQCNPPPTCKAEEYSHELPPNLERNTQVCLNGCLFNADGATVNVGELVSEDGSQVLQEGTSHGSGWNLGSICETDYVLKKDDGEGKEGESEGGGNGTNTGQ